MTITYQREPITLTLKQECRALLDLHYREVGPPSWGWLDVDIPLDPSWDRYEELERNGAYHILTVRDDGRLIGYSCWTLVRNHHYRDIIDAANDIYFLHPDYRGKTVGYRLFTKAEEMVIEACADMPRKILRIENTVKLHDGKDEAPRRVLEASGYHAVETVFWKVIPA